MSQIDAAAIRAARHRLSDLTGRAHVVLTGRGASALCAALQAIGCAGRGVIIPANTCYIVLWAVLSAGAIPLLADVDPLTGQMTTDTLDALPVTGACALIPACLYGLPCDLTAIAAWGRARGLAVIADCALCLQPPDTRMTDAVILSFGPGKPIDHGMGGALACDEGALAREVSRIAAAYPLLTDTLRRRARQWDDLYWALHQHDADQPALAALYPPLFAHYGDLTTIRLPADGWRGLLGRLDPLPAAVSARLRRQRLYDRLLGGLPLRLPAPESTPLWRYPIYVPADLRAALLDHLWSEGFHSVTRWYPSLQPMARALVPHRSTETPHADRLGAEVIALPLDVTDAEVIGIATCIRMVFRFSDRGRSTGGC
ncbi:MAG: DegT/DnrJ/EryC1/StrS family aminotransferase [Candidatus Flexifilum sp.]|jgi:dTDP-4-amino-4,6-dideoxygalactose transaminase